MNPVLMIALFVALNATFLYTAVRRTELLQVGRWEDRFQQIPERIKAVVIYALGQKKMHFYPLAGFAHQIIFVGFSALLVRTLILWSRGVWAPSNLFLFGPDQLLGHIYEPIKDLVAVLVVAGVSVFVYLRTVRKTRRMTLSAEALVILGIIFSMMVADMLYDGAMLALTAPRADLTCGDVGEKIGLCARIADITAPMAPVDAFRKGATFIPTMPIGSLLGMAFVGLPSGVLAVIATLGFWTHATLPLVFLNILPLSKHFHIITVIPNVAFLNLEPKGALPMMAPNSDGLMELVGAATDKTDVLEDPVGIARAEHFTWKAILDFYTCTECGRCSDNCPAHKTGKMLSPKQLTLNLRDHMYERDRELVHKFVEAPYGFDRTTAGMAAAEAEGRPVDGYTPVDLVGNVIHPDVLWACTTCRACEEQCPVMISYVDKIVSMRRNLVVVKGEFPAELQKPFNGMETNGNPWNLSRMDRAAWTDGLDIKTMAENPTAPVLYWVGCAASYDDRAKKIARATANLLKEAGVEFAILGEEETCTGDPARRAGNEYLYLMLAEQNVATLKGYQDQGGIRTVLTTCPHCFNSLLNEYPQLGAKLKVMHHTDYLLELVKSGKLKPKKKVDEKVVFHDSCYLGRYNDVYEEPRDLLKTIPGLELLEVEGWNRNKGLCCGAGGAQMWMEEQNKDRVNVKRTLQLVGTGAKTVASGCPFCMTMLTDGLKDQELEAKIQQKDVAELLAESCLG
jgi:Fe-S oxidoreductase